MKRLERGTFRAASAATSQGSARVEIPRRDLAMLLEGIDPKNVTKSRRFACAVVERV
jgi:hypothetical protein